MSLRRYRSNCRSARQREVNKVTAHHGNMPKKTVRSPAISHPLYFPTTGIDKTHPLLYNIPIYTPMEGENGMASLTVNVKFAKKCAFCRYWHDPACTAIVPKAPSMWEIRDINQKRLCTKKNLQMPANAFCGSDYVCKL